MTELTAKTLTELRDGLRARDFTAREIRFVDEMPRSTLEKVAKAELRKMLV